MDLDELREVMLSHGKDPALARQLMKRYDKDKSWTLDRSELVELKRSWSREIAWHMTRGTTRDPDEGQAEAKWRRRDLVSRVPYQFFRTFVASIRAEERGVLRRGPRRPRR